MRYFHPARPNELQCDLDDDRAVKQFKRGVALLRQCFHFKVTKVSVVPSSTPGHSHGRVWLSKPLHIMERIALQGALGDDGVRTLMNWGRARNRDPHPVLLINLNKETNATTCFCGSTKQLPRCNCLRKFQSSKASFEARKAHRQ